GSTALVLSNPIAAPDKRRDLITRFIEEKGDICFWQISRPVAHILEITFLVRPVVFEDEPDVRKFFTFDQDGQLKAFAFFDPVYEEGEVVGYLCSTRRRLPEADSLVGYAQMRHAIETFQQEGKRYLF